MGHCHKSKHCSSNGSQNYPSEPSQIRFLHNVAGAPAVDIYIGNQRLVENLEYKEVTAYLDVPVNKFLLTVRVANTGNAILQRKLRLRGGPHTAGVTGVTSRNNFSAYLYKDNNTVPRQGFLHLRFIHLAAGVPAVDVYAGVNRIFSNVPFGSTGNPTYLPIRLIGDSFTNIFVKTAGSSNVLAGPFNFRLSSGTVHSVFASGLLGSTQFPLTAVVARDNTGINEMLQSDFRPQEYMGTWYQIASIPQPYQAGCDRSRAEYTLLNQAIKVVNTCFRLGRGCNNGDGNGDWNRNWNRNIDGNGDGIPDGYQNGDWNGDWNGDGIPDNNQDLVAGNNNGGFLSPNGNVNPDNVDFLVNNVNRRGNIFNDFTGDNFEDAIEEGRNYLGRRISSITGTAVAPNPLYPAALKVDFPVQSSAGDVELNYLIHRTDYMSYAVVGSPDRSSLYILSRTPRMSRSRYETLVQFAASLGYDISKLVVDRGALIPRRC